MYVLMYLWMLISVKYFFTNNLTPMYYSIFVLLFMTMYMYHYTAIFFFSNYIYFFMNFNFQYDFFGLTLFALSVITCMLCVLVVDLKFMKVNYLIVYFFFFLTVVLWFFFSSNNMMIFFLMYELLLFPSVFLTYMSSPNMRSKNVSFYFLLWTQLGSFFMLISVLMLITKLNKYLFTNMYYTNFSHEFSYMMKLFMFVGFGMKMPMWPFHFWLTKTHVEANTSFSIFLSGILVKTALFGLYKFNIFYLNNNYYYFFWVFLGLLDVSMKLSAQMDLKKIVAYCTVFEMNLILINFFFLSYSSYLFLMYFSVLHTLLSFFFFFSVDCIFKRYNSRSILAMNNIITFYPNLGLCIMFGMLLFNGIPLTLKFNLELLLFMKLFTLNFIYFYLFFFVQMVFMIFFSKSFFSMLFSTKKMKPSVDLTTKEMFIYYVLFYLFLVLSFL